MKTCEILPKIQNRRKINFFGVYFYGTKKMPEQRPLQKSVYIAPMGEGPRSSLS